MVFSAEKPTLEKEEEIEDEFSPEEEKEAVAVVQRMIEDPNFDPTETIEKMESRLQKRVGQEMIIKRGYFDFRGDNRIKLLRQIANDNRFGVYDEKFVNKLINSQDYYTSVGVKFLPHNLHKEFLFRALEKDAFDLRELSSLENVDEREVLDWLFKNNRGDDAVRMARRFKSVPFREIFYRIIGRPSGPIYSRESLGDLIREIDFSRADSFGLSEEDLRVLILKARENDLEDIVLEHYKAFEGCDLNMVVCDYIRKEGEKSAGFVGIIIQGVGEFYHLREKLDLKMIADSLLENGVIVALADSWNHLRDSVDDKFLNKALDAAMAGKNINTLNYFSFYLGEQNRRRIEVIRRLVDIYTEEKDFHSLTYSTFFEFKGIDEETFEKFARGGAAPFLIKRFADVKKVFGLKSGYMIRVLFESDIAEFIRNSDAFDASDLNAIKEYEKDYHVLSFLEDIGLPSNNIYSKYRDLKNGNDRLGLNGFVSRIAELRRGMISNGEYSLDSLSEYYEEVLKAVYPNNSGANWTNFESNESCGDRTGDLAKYKIRPVYKINLAEGVELKLKDGTVKNERLLGEVEGPIRKIQEEFAAVDFNRKKMREILDKKIDELLRRADLKSKEGIFVSREEKLFLLSLESVAGRFDPDDLKEVMIGYQFAEFEDIRNYLEGTRDRVGQAKNQDYAYLLELTEFFADRIKEVQRSVVQKSLENSRIKEILPEYYKEKSKLEGERILADDVNKLRLDTIGLRGNILQRVFQELNREKVRGKEYHLVELDKDGNPILDENGNLIPSKKAQAVAGMIFSEQRKAADAIKTLSGKSINPDEINLGDLNFQEYLEVDRGEGEYNEELFSKYLTVAFQSIFNRELSLIKEEIGKYEEAEGGKDRKVRQLEGYITKNKPSAHARQAGGVCVAGDNPSKGEKNMWDMANYFQMVLKDPEKGDCKGLVLLHSFEDKNKKILTASFNPSSTYLYTVNEKQMFRQLLEKLAEFARDNDFDMIAISKNGVIRTNRTGGEFEREMSDTINKMEVKFELSEEKVFSYCPPYNLKDLDVVWVNK